MAESFDAAVIGAFLCAHHGVSDVTQIEPFGKRQYAWEVCRPTVLLVEMNAQGVCFDSNNPDYESQVHNAPLAWRGSPQPRDPFKHPSTGEPMTVDLERVFIYNIACRNYASSVPGSVGVRLNYYHGPMAELQDTREQDEIVAAASGLRGAFAILTPTKEGESRDMTEMPMIETSFAYQNSHFIRTMALLNETNVQHGLVSIPHDVCRKARLPVWYEGVLKPSEEMINSALHSMQATPTNAARMRSRYIRNFQREQHELWGKAPKSTYFVAMPINHVLAWAFQSEAYRLSGGQRVEEFGIHHPQTKQWLLYYYLVPSALAEHALKTWRNNWHNKVDARPLSAVGFQLLYAAHCRQAMGPPGANVTGDVRIRANISYFAAPKLSPATIDGLAPALAIGFPPCHLWCQQDVERDAQIKTMLASSGAAAASGVRKTAASGL